MKSWRHRLVIFKVVVVVNGLQFPWYHFLIHCLGYFCNVWEISLPNYTVPGPFRKENCRMLINKVLIVDVNTLIGWLEPLLDRIAEDKRNVVYPQMPNIKDDTLEFRAFSARNIQVGRFDWQLIFRWMELPEYINKTRKSFISPTRCVEYK